jgi:hypothetical protein
MEEFNCFERQILAYRGFELVSINNYSYVKIFMFLSENVLLLMKLNQPKKCEFVIAVCVNDNVDCLYDEGFDDIMIGTIMKISKHHIYLRLSEHETNDLHTVMNPRCTFINHETKIHWNSIRHICFPLNKITSSMLRLIICSS